MECVDVARIPKNHRGCALGMREFLKKWLLECVDVAEFLKTAPFVPWNWENS